MLWKDSETSSDYLNFDYLVKAVKDIAMDESLTPSTIGVYGDWGSGKSSLMQMVEKSILKNHPKDTICVRFNGWLFEDYEDAKTAFCGTILDELRKHSSIPSKAKGQITKLLKKIDGKKLLVKGGALALDFLITGGLGSIASLSAEAIYSAIKDKVSNITVDDIQAGINSIKKEQAESKRDDIKNFQKDFKKILDDSEIKHLIIFVDELDRCSPDTVLDIFAAMRLFLFVKNTSFIIGADNRLIDYSIKTRYKNIPGNNLDISKEYLEKLIQYPITIPKLDQLELERYLTCLLLEKEITNLTECVKDANMFEPIDSDKLVSLHPDKETKIKEALLLSKQISPTLAAKLNGNPRQCKRFLNTLFMRLDMAKSRNVALDKNVLAKLMLLEYFKESMYEVLMRPENKEYLKALESNPQPSSDNVLSRFVEDEWVKGWMNIKVKLGECDLKPYYYFSRSTQRIDQSIKNLLSPDAEKCLDAFLSRSDSQRERVHNLFETLNDSEKMLVVDQIFDEMIKGEDLDAELFKSLVAAVSCDSLLAKSVEILKKIPALKFTTGMVGQLTSLKSKLSNDDAKELDDYLNANAALSKAQDLTNRLGRKKHS